MKNYIVSCISPLNPRSSLGQYLDAAGSGKKVEGITTNEAPARAVIDYIENSHLGRLDGVIAICSSKVSNETLQDALAVEKVKELEQISGISPAGRLTHYDFYRNRIEAFAQSFSSQYKDRPIDFQTIEMADTPDGKQIALVAAQTMDTIGSAEANLFIDFNGGPRQFAFMLLSMANLAKFRKTKIARVISMNYDNKINGMIPIQDMDNVFTSHDLVSGMDEFINFGRSSSLKKYFRNTGNPAIHSVLNAMEQFSDDLLLCRVEPLLDDIDRLKEKLNDYTCSDSARTSDDDYDVLFMYVTEDILRSFQPLFDKQLPEMIQWCVENDFIMQALTFVTELSPHYFAQTAFQPTKEEWDDFLHALKHKNVQKTSLRDSAKPSASDDKKDYDWFNSWTNSRESDKIKRSLNGLVLSPDSVFPEIRNWEAARLEKTILRQWPEAKDDKLFTCCKKALEKRAILESTERVLAADSERMPADFERAVCLYNILKEQRHLTNHASTTGSNVWSLDTVKKYLRIYVDLLRKLR